MAAAWAPALCSRSQFHCRARIVTRGFSVQGLPDTAALAGADVSGYG